jgi:hypothetical protein
LVRTNLAALATPVLSALGDPAPGNFTQMWECLLLLMKTFRNELWIHVDSENSLYKKVYALLKQVRFMEFSDSSAKQNNNNNNNKNVFL